MAANSGGGGWDAIGAEVPFRGQEQEQNREQANMERQQRKIIASMMYDVRYLSEPDVNLPQWVEEDFLAKIGSGEISEEDQKAFLGRIAGPVRLNGAAAVNEKLGDSKHFRRILGYALAGGAGFRDYSSMMGKKAVSDFESSFPTPMDFERVRETLLNRIRQGSGEAKYHEYVEDMDKFQKAIYGKKYEYYKSLVALKEKGGQPTAELTAELPSEVTGESGEAENYTDAEKEQILQQAIVDGDDFVFQGQKFKLTPEILKDTGLSPEYKMMLGETEIGFSSCFNANGKDTVIGYVRTDDGYKVRGYYRSGSQGVWRYMPDYVAGGNDGLSWYGKGYTEEMMTLPCEMQKELSRVAEGEKVPVGQKTVPAFLLAGTAKVWPSRDAYRQAVLNHTLRGDVYQEVDANPEVDFGKASANKKPPEELAVSEDLSPNYGEELLSWESDTGIYGHLVNRVFESHDGRLKYTISEDNFGRCFVSSIETNAALTSCGIRREWVAGGDVETPIYEYASQASGYGNVGDTRGQYVGMWENYVSRLKIIQDYLVARKS